MLRCGFVIGLLILAWPMMATLAESQPLRVAIIDTFYPPLSGLEDAERRRHITDLHGMLDLDRDTLREPFFHGDLVQMIAASPRFSFLHYPMRNNGDPLQEILLNLRKLLVDIRQRPVDALILSWESSTLISAFERPLRLQRVGIYRWQIRQWGLTSPSWQTTDDIIDALESLVDEGVLVFTIAGNGGRRMVNTFSFAEGVITVGAREPELAHFVADNVFVDSHEQAAYTLTRVDDHQGQALGYDIDGNGCSDIPMHLLTGYGKDPTPLPKRIWPPLKGSSFAAPMALKRLLAGKPPAGPC